MGRTSKELVLLGLLVGIAALFWLSLAQLLPHLAWDLNPVLISAFAASFLLMVIWGIAALLVERAAFLVIAWAATAYLGVLWIVDPLFLGVSTLLFLFGIVGFFRAKNEIQRTLGGGIVRPLRKVIPLTATFLVAVISTAAYLRAPAHTLEVKNVVPERWFGVAVKYAEPLIQQINPTFAADRTFREYVVMSAEAEGAELAPAEEAAVVNQAIRMLEREEGITLKAEDTLTTWMYRVGLRFIERQTTLYNAYFPIAYALGLFVTLRFLAIILNWFVIALVAVLLRFLHRLGIVELRSVPATITAYSFL